MPKETKFVEGEFVRVEDNPRIMSPLWGVLCVVAYVPSEPSTEPYKVYIFSDDIILSIYEKDIYSVDKTLFVRCVKLLGKLLSVSKNNWRRLRNGL